MTGDDDFTRLPALERARARLGRHLEPREVLEIAPLELWIYPDVKASQSFCRFSFRLTKIIDVFFGGIPFGFSEK